MLMLSTPNLRVCIATLQHDMNIDKKISIHVEITSDVNR